MKDSPFKGKGLTGSRFGKLVVLKMAPFYYSESNPTKRKPVWICRCDCGSEKIIHSSALTSARTVSCGCLRKGPVAWTHPIYTSWSKMKDRCLNPNHVHFDRYGGAGVKICARWMDFDKFYEDVSPTWKDGHSIDRHPNQSGDYTPNNFRWATAMEQANNRKNNVLLTHEGNSLSVSQWSRMAGINRHTLEGRLARGWTTFDALTRPVHHV